MWGYLMTSFLQRTTRTPRGFSDRGSYELNAMRHMLHIISSLWELHGFEALDTPIVEYSSALGQFLQEQDQTTSEIFSWKDQDDQWLALRYDLTAPLARFAARNWDTLSKPYRSYRSGWVFRNEKPGASRFRQFMQCDADILSSKTVAADAELCMLMADTLSKLGVSTTNYRIRLNNRKILDGLLKLIGTTIHDTPKKCNIRMRALRAIDKLDRLGIDAVCSLLGPGRMDDSGDFTKGAGLADVEINKVLSYLQGGANSSSSEETINAMEELVSDTTIGREGINELRQINNIITAMGYSQVITVDPSIVRGLEYYTGPIYEASIVNSEHLNSSTDSVGGGGRYDNLISRLNRNLDNNSSASSGFSIGISRLFTVMNSTGGSFPGFEQSKSVGPIIITVIDPSYLIHYHKLANQLHQADIKSEVYAGDGNLKVQMKYADRRNAPCAIIQGRKEMSQGVIQIKNLILGKQLSKTVSSNKEWRENHPAQLSVPEYQMVPTIKVATLLTVTQG